MTEIDRDPSAGVDGSRTADVPRAAPPFGRAGGDAEGSLLFGVPMNWMTRWPGDYPVFVDRAEGARFWDVDGNVFVDFCLGDTGGMAGHAPKVSVDAIATQAARGITLMLPTEDAAWVGREMARRFGVPYWNFTLTATDANRFAIRWARQVTGRSKVVVHNWCYHGSVDESFATLDDHRARSSRGTGTSASPSTSTRRRWSWRSTTSTGLERALATGDAAVCMFEPALTNIGIVLPDPGYHEAVRELCTRYGTLLLIDETHTISAGPGGCTEAWGLRPDIVTIGKTLGAGIPSAAYGFSRGAESTRLRAHRLEERRRRRGRRHAGRQRALAGRDARDPRRGDDRRRVRADDRARRAVRGGRPRRDRDPCGPLARRPARLPGRVPVPRPTAPAPGARRRRARTRSSTSSSTCTC